MSLNIKYLGKM